MLQFQWFLALEALFVPIYYNYETLSRQLFSIQENSVQQGFNNHKIQLYILWLTLVELNRLV
jgi:hypothetical protein